MLIATNTIGWLMGPDSDCLLGHEDPRMATLDVVAHEHKAPVAACGTNAGHAGAHARLAERIRTLGVKITDVTPIDASTCLPSTVEDWRAAMDDIRACGQDCSPTGWQDAIGGAHPTLGGR